MTSKTVMKKLNRCGWSNRGISEETLISEDRLHELRKGSKPTSEEINALKKFLIMKIFSVSI